MAAIAIALSTVSCDDDKTNGRLDPNAMISLRAGKSTQKINRADSHFSALEIVKQTQQIIFINKPLYPHSIQLSRGFADSQKDYVNERLLMWGTDIIDQQGQWQEEFIGGSDIVLVRHVPNPNILGEETLDTIAYIKNEILKQAYGSVRAAYDRGDYAEVYRLFDKAFTFEPITGPEWQEMRRLGLN